jgi:hypothetical protein
MKRVDINGIEDCTCELYEMAVGISRISKALRILSQFFLMSLRQSMRSKDQIPEQKRGKSEILESAKYRERVSKSCMCR